MERRLAAIFAADVAGYSRLIGADEEGTLARLQAHARAVRDFVRDQPELVLEDLGERALKNIAKPVQVFCIGAPVRAAGMPQVAAPPLMPDKPSIAVLPFANMSGDAEQEYFSDGMTEDLITDLSKISALFVIARNSSFAYKGRSAKVQEIGHDLGVRFVLEGSIRKAGNRVRITAQLIDAESGGHLWADRFDRDLTDIFATQDEVVEKIVRALAVTLTHGEEKRLGRRGTANVAAYEASLRARELLSRSTREGIAQARAMYHRAIELDPTYAVPHAGLAATGVSNYVSDWTDDPEAELGQSERWARRALELDDAEPFAHMALGSVMLWRRDHDGALAEFHRMSQLAPNFAQGYSATGLALMYAGRAAEAIEPFALAMRLDPHYPSIVLHF